MSKAEEKNVQKGSIWTATEKDFKVVKVSNIKGKTWVFYKQLKNKTEMIGKEYSCLKEAFVSKFIEFKNHF